MSKCKECKNNKKILTKEDLCANCYMDKFKKWPKEFQENNNKKKETKT